MKLWEYVVKHDTTRCVKLVCDKYGMSYEQYIIRDYCPMAFECFANTEFDKAFNPKRNGECKFGINDAEFNLSVNYHGSKERMDKDFNKKFKNCILCWNREIQDTSEEYELFLKLKEKYEGIK